MCIYTVKKQFLFLIKKFLKGVCDSTEHIPILGISGVKDTAKTNKDLGMLCYIQVEYIVFFGR